MLMYNNPEVARLYRLIGLFLAVSVLLAARLNVIEQAYLRNVILQNNAAILGAVIERYPDAEIDAVKLIMEYNKGFVNTGMAALRNYGLAAVDGLNDTYIVNRFGRTSAILNISMLLLASFALTVLFGLFIKSVYKRIDEVSRYTKKVQSGDFSLDIRDNSEGDISMLKNQIYKITVMLKEQAEVLERDKINLSNSIADISHQLKTPITSLGVLNDLMYDDLPPETRTAFLDKMRSQVQRMEWLISSLLKLAKFDAGTVVMKREKVIIRGLIDKALDHVCIPIEIKGLHVTIAGDSNAAFTVDFNWTCEALINILKNAVEHTPENGHIRISYQDNPIYTQITIADNGIGIHKEDLPYIFNRFYKGKNASDDSVGIGLAMAKAIVSRQGGDITAESEPAHGTVFTLKFYKSM